MENIESKFGVQFDPIIVEFDGKMIVYDFWGNDRDRVAYLDKDSSEFKDLKQVPAEVHVFKICGKNMYTPDNHIAGLVFIKIERRKQLPSMDYKD